MEPKTIGAMFGSLLLGIVIGAGGFYFHGRQATQDVKAEQKADNQQTEDRLDDKQELEAQELQTIEANHEAKTQEVKNAHIRRVVSIQRHAVEVAAQAEHDPELARSVLSSLAGAESAANSTTAFDDGE
jgi:uncharacterized protein HemX